MKKNAKNARAKKTTKAKIGKKYVCDACGIALSVDNDCACDPCDIMCCGQNMRIIAC